MENQRHRASLFYQVRISKRPSQWTGEGRGVWSLLGTFLSIANSKSLEFCFAAYTFNFLNVTATATSTQFTEMQKCIHEVHENRPATSRSSSLIFFSFSFLHLSSFFRQKGPPQHPDGQDKLPVGLKNISWPSCMNQGLAIYFLFSFSLW